MPALGAEFNSTTLMGAAPLALAIGAGAFALLALSVLRSLKRDNLVARQQAGEQIASLRAMVDEYEALLSGARDLTLLWTTQDPEPRYLGQAANVLPAGTRPDDLLDFSAWLENADADLLASAIGDLRINGQVFDLPLEARDGRIIEASGWVMGGLAAVRLRPALVQDAEADALSPRSGMADGGSARAIFRLFTNPAFIRDQDDALIFANTAYLQLARSLGKEGTEAAPPELMEQRLLSHHLAAVENSQKPQVLSVSFGTSGSYDLCEFPISGGKAGYLRPRGNVAQPAAETGLAQVSSVIDVVSTPIAIFNAKRELVQYNRAYATLWGLDPAWLKPGLDERAILDRLRTDGKLPAEPDYQAWRNQHLTSYTLTKPRSHEHWHLPDGRTLNVISAPAGAEGGVIYVFEDLSARLQLESQNKSLVHVQRETLNALSEAVAVFGTNGKLTLSNPQLSSVWKLPMNELGQSPHIDQIAEACGRAMPEDGASIWRELKRHIIDLNPNRDDKKSRISRADGRLLDYAVTRLPDGQTMMTFLDVTESANYSRVLKERNDALVTADRLKDAFVENVSYELRSPLTNIIGFADLLSSEEIGPLNERQRAYTDYIRASSVTLGVLIDNILDLATVDAGIAELQPELQDVPTLIAKAKAGLAATFPEISGEQQLNLVVDVPHNLPPFIADGTRIVQVLYNLLSNAARFSEPGTEIRLSVVPRGERMVFIVEDEGTGMTEEMKAAILERNDTSAAGRQRGAGLGLAIVKTFVNLHGGTINVEKREPRGTRVIVNLPRDAAFAGAAE